MADQDSQIRPSHALERIHGYADRSANPAQDHEPPLGATVVAWALRRRWWAFLLIAICSAAIAGLAASQFSRTNVTLHASLIHTGLPGTPEAVVYQPLPPSTCSELLSSIRVVDKLRESQGLNMPYTALRQRVSAKANQHSNLLSITLTWGDLDEGIAVLNKLLDIFAEEIAAQRRQTLRAHMTHIEMTLLQARAEVDQAEQQIQGLREEQQRIVDQGGLNSERYRSLLDSASATELAINEKRVAKLGVEQQISALDEQIVAAKMQQLTLVAEIKRDLSRAASTMVADFRQGYSSSAQEYRKLTSLLEEIEAFPTAPGAPSDIPTWCKKLAELWAKDYDLPEADLIAWRDTERGIVESASAKMSAHVVDISKLEDDRDRLQLSLIPVRNQIEMLDNRLTQYKQESEQVAAEISGIGTSTIDSFQQQLDIAASKQESLTQQLDAMRQLEKCQIKEWTISSPASDRTALFSSNSKKLFFMTFGLAEIVLSVPVFFAEWNRLRPTPQSQFAKSLRLPVLSERILQDYSPDRRLFGRSGSLNEQSIEAIRTLTLRIQQSAHNRGSVILFSSVDHVGSAMPLLAAVAECLAEREERVLVVDAVSPDRSRIPLANLLADERAAPPSTEVGQASRRAGLSAAPGLAEYLSADCETIQDLVRPSGCPGVDVISSGAAVFAREALASNCLTQLIEACRRNYTLILVNGPCSTCVADMQMLAARADGIVLTATSEVKYNRMARHAVNDLIELGAPIIGVVT